MGIIVNDTGICMRVTGVDNDKVILRYYNNDKNIPGEKIKSIKFADRHTKTNDEVNRLYNATNEKKSIENMDKIYNDIKRNIIINESIALYNLYPDMKAFIGDIVTLPSSIILKHGDSLWRAEWIDQDAEEVKVLHTIYNKKSMDSVNCDVEKFYDFGQNLAIVITKNALGLYSLSIYEKNKRIKIGEEYLWEIKPYNESLSINDTVKLSEMYSYYFEETVKSSKGKDRTSLYNRLSVFFPDNCKEWVEKPEIMDLLIEKICEKQDGGKEEGDKEQDSKALYESYLSIPKNTSDFNNIDNEIINIIVSLAQGFSVIISGKAGSAKGAICDAIGGLLDFAKVMINNKTFTRYSAINASRTWKDKNVFLDSFLNESNIKEMLEILQYERLNGCKGKELPYIISINNADAESIDHYFEDFIDVMHDWYRTKDSSRLGKTDISIEKNLRFILTVNNNEKGSISRELQSKVAVIEVSEPAKVISGLKRLNYGLFFELFKESLPEYEKVIDREETIDSLSNEIKYLYEVVIKKIEENVLCDGVQVQADSTRVQHAVARYINAASKYMKTDSYEKDIIKSKCFPGGLLIDEDCINTDERTGELISLDYILAERVLTSFTRTNCVISIEDISGLLEFFISEKLYKCAGEIKSAIEIGHIKVLESLSDRSNENYIIKKSKKLYSELQVFEGDKEAIIDYICNSVNSERDKDYYTKNVIMNMCICMTQGFLTVFSGKPGCGKTSICKILGKTFGLNNMGQFQDQRHENVNISRYMEISTERGWTSKRDFIGYYNPLTEQFDKSNALLYNAFLIMDSETKDKESDVSVAPCFILLDEANLSPMEFYWSDFMNTCEKWDESNSIDLGGGRVFNLPEGLHFLATINNDHTTEILSPRLIDRANVIDLPSVSKITVNGDMNSNEEGYISWQQFKDVFGCDENKGVLFNDEYTEIKSLYDDVKRKINENFSILISPRTDIAVNRYFTKAKELFEEENYYVLQTDGLTDCALRIDDNSLLKVSDECSEDDKVKWLKELILNGNDEDNSTRKINDSGEEKELSYNQITVPAEIQAIDYCVAQRLLPKLTDVSGGKAFDDLIILTELLFNNKLYKSAGIVIDMLDRGHGNGFYNYFR